MSTKSIHNMHALNVYLWSVLCALVCQTPGAVRSESAWETQRYQVPSATADNMCFTKMQRLSTKPRWKDYLWAKQNTYTWFDQLEVDHVELMQYGIKGKKSLPIGGAIQEWALTLDETTGLRTAPRSHGVHLNSL